jgi:anti-anti-sigma regulatory factor
MDGGGPLLLDLAGLAFVGLHAHHCLRELADSCRERGVELRITDGAALRRLEQAALLAPLAAA